MKTTLEKLEGNQVALEVEVDEERVEKAVEDAFRKVAQKVKVPGFRAGKAPRRVIETRVGRGFLYQEALDELIPQVYTEAVEENNLKPIDVPAVDILDMEEGKPLRFKAVIEVEPEVILGEYKGLAATKQTQRITNSDVDEVLEDMRERNAQLVTTERNELAAGDFAVIDFTGYIGDQPFPGGAAQGHTLEIGGGQFIPGFEEQLIGAELGETREVLVTFPTDYGSTELAGKEARFDVKIHEIKEKSSPALNDDFAKDVGDFETLLELRADIRKKLEDAAEQQAKRQLEEDLVQATVEGAQVDVPAKMIDWQTDHKMERLENELESSGLNKEQYLQILGTPEEELRARLKTDAEAEVKTSLVIDAIIAAENITVSDEEMDERIETMVGDGPHAETTRNFWTSQKKRLRDTMIREKAITLLVEHAQIDEVEVDKPAEGSEAIGEAVEEEQV